MPHRLVVVVILIVASFMDLLDTTIVNVALPSIQEDLSASAAQLEWIVSGYVLAYAVLLITGGRLGDIFGRKRLFLVGVAGFTLVSAACAAAGTGETLVTFRIVQGLFAALMTPQVLSVIQVLFSPKERAPVFGALGAISGLAAVAGPLVGGVLVSGDVFGLGWRTVFLINVPVGILLFIAALVVVPESRSADSPRLDLLGVFLVSLGLFLAVFALIEGREQDWAPWIWMMLGASPVILIIFVVYQSWRDKRDGSALVPPSLFNNRGYSAGVITQFALSSSIGAFFLILVLYLQVGLRYSAIDAALAALPFSIGALIGSFISVPLGPRLGKGLIAMGGVAQITGLIWISGIVRDTGDALVGADLILPMALAGIGLTLEIVPLTDVALANTTITNAGAASGVFGMVQQVAGALGVAIVGVVFFGLIGTTFTSAVVRDAFLGGIWVPIVALALSAIAAIFLPSVAAVRRHKADAENAIMAAADAA
ncbi:MFS transporter [Subtercola frigoramans]|uniref:EmrB/QacA subfamily drug resistance transporter n=1 Tax=Subtercola frigoramans TaxID=120298 RepID=A0ABS2L7H8_9MICO|nr:MFS transporter [Subtercola frigoramans]MBM7473058.1 EmrB/QacA subfamily drug resistance transporter [Subtercola frigoramans]